VLWEVTVAVIVRKT